MFKIDPWRPIGRGSRTSEAWDTDGLRLGFICGMLLVGVVFCMLDALEEKDQALIKLRQEKDGQLTKLRQEYREDITTYREEMTKKDRRAIA